MRSYPEAPPLLRGPWCWPPEADGADLERARRRCRRDAAPVPRPGDALAVSVREGYRSASLWLVAFGGDPAGRGESVAFEGSAAEAWRTAVRALGRSIPVLWNPLPEPDRNPPRAYYLDSLCEDARLAPAEQRLEGSSFGLTLLLAAASYVTGTPLAPDLAASAALDDDGAVQGVDALDLKIRAIEESAPRVQRLLVAPQDEALARQVARRLTILPVPNAQAALGHAFPRPLEETLIEAGAEQETRKRLIESFLDLALRPRTAVLDWTPIRDAASLALDRWRSELGPSEVARLEFTQAVAARHQINQGVAPTHWRNMVEKDGTLPARLQILAHLVQQCADTGSPAPTEIRRYADEHVGRPGDRFPEAMRLAGAVARLDAVTGHPHEALRSALELTDEFLSLSSDQAAQCSMPLGLALRLAGALRDEAALDEALARHRRALGRGGLGVGAAYLELARRRAEWDLRGSATPEQEAAFRELAAEADAPAEVRWCALRYLSRSGDPAVRGSALAALESAGELREEDDKRCHRELAHLDAALRERKEPAAAAAVDALRGFEPGLVGHLTAAAEAAGEPVPEYVARFYPY